MYDFERNVVKKHIATVASISQEKVVIINVTSQTWSYWWNLMYEMICTRPHIAQVVGEVSEFKKNLGGEH